MSLQAMARACETDDAGERERRGRVALKGEHTFDDEMRNEL